MGGRLIPRIEKRTGKTFERKTIKGRRLIHCPPVVAHEYADDIPPLGVQATHEPAPVKNEDIQGFQLSRV
jgi:hypothetical protein